jgi:hypothetical protein
VGKLWRINLVRHSMASHQAGFIAVCIEPLLMIFKFALKSDSEHIIKAIWIIITAAAGIIGSLCLFRQGRGDAGE